MIWAAGLTLVVVCWPQARPRRPGSPSTRRRVVEVPRGMSPALPLVSFVLLAALATTEPTLAVLMALVAGAIGWAWRRQAVARGEAERAAAVVPTIELVVVVLGAGGTVADAVDVIGRDGPAVARRAAAAVARLSAAGRPLARALPALSEEMGPELVPLVRVLQASVRDGAGIGDTLVRLGGEAQRGRRRAAEVRARQLPVKLLVPLVVCLLPAVLVGSVLPLVLVGLDAIPT